MALLSKLKSLQHLKSTLARNASWMLVGQGFKLLIQALYFTVIARSLGAQNYGAFVGVVGLVGIQMLFATLGSGFLLIKKVSRKKEQFHDNLGRALLTTVLASTTLFAIVLLASRLLLPSIPLALVMLIAAADLFGSSMIYVCGYAFIAFEQMGWTAAINALLSASRLVAAIILTILHSKPTALEWGQFYFASTISAGLLSLLVVFLRLGVPKFRFEQRTEDIREGFYFSVMQSAQTIYNDIDKAMLARLSTLEAAGIYGAAYRIIDVSFAPVASVLAAAYPNFFRVGVGGILVTLRYARPLIARALGYAALIAVAILAGAGVVPLILGSEYRLTSEALRWLAVLPLLKAVHSFLGDALTGAGYQALRTAIGAGVAMFSVCINMWVIPVYSWRGAAWSSIASDALLLSAFATAAFALLRRSKHLASPSKVIEARAET